VDPLLQDLAPTPFDNSPVPKVGVHGNLIKTIASGRFLRHLPESAEAAITFLLTLAVAGLAVSGGVRSIRDKIFGGVLVAAFVAYAFILFGNHDLVLPLAMPMGAVFTASFAAIGWQLLDEEKQKGRLRGMFSTYVSPQLVESMVESGGEPQLGGHEADITSYFSDIESFSAIGEKLLPSQLVELMNEYFTAYTDIVLAQGGLLDKYIGDMVVAMFGGLVPLQDHALRACVTSQLVQRRLGELREKWRGEGDKWPELVWRMQSRIGLNSGPAIVGNMGSSARFNYTMMGDNVNLAARMESGAKAYGVYTMAAEPTKLACERQGPDRVVFRHLDRIVVKGRSKPIPIYESVGLKEDVTAPTRECIGLFEQGLARYFAQDWDAAEALFRRSAVLEANQSSQTSGVEINPSRALISRCSHMRAHPPGADWDGVYVMKVK
jgi:adenylate cyclase